MATSRSVALDPDPTNNAIRIVVSGASTAAPAPTRPTRPSRPAGTTKTGTSRADVLRGGVGNDTLRGLAGNDRLFGGSGNDRLVGGLGRDTHDGGRGNDAITATDKTRDTIRCGSGRDTVVADRIDTVARDCETVRRR